MIDGKNNFEVIFLPFAVELAKLNSQNQCLLFLEKTRVPFSTIYVQNRIEIPR